MRKLFILLSCLPSLFVLSLAIVFRPPSPDTSPEIRKRLYLFDSNITRSQFPAEVMCKDSPDLAVPPSERRFGHADLVFRVAYNQGIDWTQNCVYNVPIFKRTTPWQDQLALLFALTELLEMPPGIVVQAYVGRNVLPNIALLQKQLLDKGFVIISATGNEGLKNNPRCIRFPACYNKYHGNKIISSSRDKRANLFERALVAPLHLSTSESTGYFAGKLLKGHNIIELREKYETESWEVK